ncbi:hypothetical protein DH2020_009365 [Rehmannia glutinosa]|uniref:WRKY domain-containing protein n=1 Tax=Rehmannia glutinosa TaxID=99300 RepID=A0ABR0X633_REHGL
MEDVKGCKVDEEIININESFKCNEEYAIIKEDEFESTKLEMTGVREENMRLKTLLQRIEKDYKDLQMQFMDIFQQESKKNNGSPISNTNGDDQEQELVSLRLGTSPKETKKENIHNLTKIARENDVFELGLGHNPKRLKTDDGALGKNSGPDNNYVLTGKKEENQKWGQNKGLKTERSGDEELCQTSVKRARVCVRARCDTPTMNDGCQWRKYGQKIAKGNPCPRAYYRCTVSPSCPVRKQVQRCMEDMSILITTYEGTHNHPLPISATAMASTTSAAASMLLSGSTTSQPSPTALNLYGGPPTFHHSDKQHCFLPNSPSPTPFSTITLDLTTNPSTTTHGGQEQQYQSYLEKFNQASSKQALTETLTKVITSDPSFRSVIAAVVSTMAANEGAGKVKNEMINGKVLLSALENQEKK